MMAGCAVGMWGGMPVFVDSFVAPIRDNAVVQVAVMAVLLLITLDVVFGICKAVATKTFSSEKMRAGIAHKCGSFGFLLVGIVIDGTIIGGFDIGYSAPVLTGVCVYLCIMEIASLLESFCVLNPQLAGSPLFRLLDSVKGIGGEHDHVG